MTAAFHEIDWTAPYDLAAHVLQVPSDATVKGMFFHSPLTLARAHGGSAPGRGTYVAFKDYPVREHMEVLAACAAIAYPELPIRRGLCMLGREAYLTFVESTVGKVTFAVAGRSWNGALRLATKAYGIVGNKSSAELEEVDANSAVVRLRGVWNMPDSYHVGIFEGGFQQFGLDGRVLVHEHSPCEMQFKLIWA